MKATTSNTFLAGRLKVKQHRDGYRFSLDSILLAAFTRLKPRDRVVDLGTGCGIIALIAACLNPTVTVVGVEVQPDLITLARANAAENGLANRVSILDRDLRRLRRSDFGSVDLVVTNPPYRRSGSGRLNPDDEKAAARHEILSTLADFITAARRLLEIGGRLTAVYPVDRGVDLLWHLRHAGLEPKRLRLVHPYPGARAGQVLVEAVKGAGPGLRVDAPLTVRETPAGSYHNEIAAFFSPGHHGRINGGAD